jgi:NAD(P)-dependent dehydrogenase (short-subunit alcohol dehydrogenase family)
MAGRLDGKVCVITGAASGIGAETARLFAEEGARVVGVDLAEGAEGELALQADVADEDAVREMYVKAAEDMGRIDVLFNNAGISPDDDVSVLDTSLEAWQRVQDVNLKSVFLCCKHGMRGVRVNALCPGPVNTPLLQELFAADPEKAARRLIHLPMGRFAEAREIAQGALFLASDESSYVTASTFLVDGGLSGAYVTPE